MLSDHLKPSHREEIEGRRKAAAKELYKVYDRFAFATFLAAVGLWYGKDLHSAGLLVAGVAGTGAAAMYAFFFSRHRKLVRKRIAPKLAWWEIALQFAAAGAVCFTRPELAMLVVAASCGIVYQRHLRYINQSRVLWFVVARRYIRSLNEFRGRTPAGQAKPR